MEFTKLMENAYYHAYETNVWEPFIKLALAGRTSDKKRIFVNAVQDIPTHNQYLFRIFRDIDSAIGFSEDLPFTKALAVFPLAPFSEALKEDIHLRGKAYDTTVSPCNHQRLTSP